MSGTNGARSSGLVVAAQPIVVPRLAWWRAIFDESEADKFARLVALTVSVSFNTDNWCQRSVALLAADAAVDEATIRNRTSVLEELGYLNVVRGGGRGRSHEYTATLPDHATKGWELSTLLAQRKGGSQPPFSAVKGGSQAVKGGPHPPHSRVSRENSRDASLRDAAAGFANTFKTDCTHDGCRGLDRCRFE